MTHQSAETARQSQMLKQQGEDIKEIKNFLMGDHEHPGIVTRMDRIEQSHYRYAKFVWISVAALIGLIFNALTSVFSLPK